MFQKDELGMPLRQTILYASNVTRSPPSVIRRNRDGNLQGGKNGRKNFPNRYFRFIPKDKKLTV